MRRLGFALGVAALLATTGSLSGTAAGSFDQKLSKDKQAIHALNRLTFGPRPGDVERVRRLGIEKWIRQQLTPERIPESPTLEARLQSFETLQLSTPQLLEKYGGPTIVVTTTFQPAQAVATQLQQLVRRVRVVPLAQLLSEDERRIVQQGSNEDKRALLMSLDPEKRRQVLRALPVSAIADIPELRRESMAARQPQQFVTQEQMDGRLLRALYSERQLEEVLVDFWLNHFNVFSSKGATRMLLPSYERDAIRPHVLGRFQDLLLATARHPAMLFYLDNWQSQTERDEAPPPRVPANARRPGLNENYGRELMELHTLGVDGGYTQDDVIAVARCFTGWTIYDVNTVAEFQFDPAMHDQKEKVVLGHTIPAGGGEQDGLQVIDILARHPSTARYLSRRLAQRFVADVPPQSLVDRMAATFTRTDGDLRAVLDAMFTSREFLSEGAWQAKLKSPLEFVVSAARALEAEVAETMALSQRIADLGQPLYGKSEPTGYANTAEAWANTAGFLGRFNAANALVSGQVQGVDFDVARIPRKPGDAAARMLGMAPSRATLETLEKGLAGQDLSPLDLAVLVIASPDFQRR